MDANRVYELFRERYERGINLVRNSITPDREGLISIMDAMDECYKYSFDKTNSRAYYGARLKPSIKSTEDFIEYLDHNSLLGFFGREIARRDFYDEVDGVVVDEVSFENGVLEVGEAAPPIAHEFPYYFYMKLNDSKSFPERVNILFRNLD